MGIEGTTALLLHNLTMYVHVLPLKANYLLQLLTAVLLNLLQQFFKYYYAVIVCIVFKNNNPVPASDKDRGSHFRKMGGNSEGKGAATLHYNK